nr:hypothetical protein [uncultured Sphingomonas sp.]
MLLPTPLLLIIGLVTAGVTACSPGGEPPQDPGQRFLCADDQPLDVIRSRDLAIVKLGERIFNLHASKGSIGERYTDGDAVLILDEGTAVFVSGDGRDAMNCELGAAA